MLSLLTSKRLAKAFRLVRGMDEILPQRGDECKSPPLHCSWAGAASAAKRTSPQVMCLMVGSCDGTR